MRHRIHRLAAAAAALVLFGLFVSAQAASASTDPVGKCSSGPQGSVCSLVQEGANGLYASGIANTVGLNSVICIDHVALYRAGVLVEAKNVTVCAVSSRIESDTAQLPYPPCPRPGSSTYTSAVQYHVGTRAEERIETAPWTFTC